MRLACGVPCHSAAIHAVNCSRVTRLTAPNGGGTYIENRTHQPISSFPSPSGLAFFLARKRLGLVVPAGQARPRRHSRSRPTRRRGRPVEIPEISSMLCRWIVHHDGSLRTADRGRATEPDLRQPHSESEVDRRDRLRHGLHVGALPGGDLGATRLPADQADAGRRRLAGGGARVRPSAGHPRVGDRHRSRQRGQGQPVRLRDACRPRNPPARVR
jgi:hypothetical protein